VHNRSNKPIAGIAIYQIFPEEVALYFNKIQLLTENNQSIKILLYMVIHDLRLLTDALIANIARTIGRLETTQAQLELVDSRNTELEAKLADFKSALCQLSRE